MAELLNIPRDVLFLIVDQLPRERDISSLCRTSRHVYGVVNPYLYRRQTRSLLCEVLGWSVLHDRADTAEKLLAAGADPCWGLGADLSFDVPLMCAAKFGSVEVTKLLFRTEGVDPELYAGTGITPMSHAASCGHEEVLKLYLADPRVHPDRRGRYARTALSHAAEARQPGTVEILLRDERVDPSVVDSDGRTPLMYAANATRENTDVLRLLLSDPRVDVNHTDEGRVTVLHVACYNGNAANITFLLDAGADVRAADYAGDTPLIASAAWGTTLPILQRLLAAPGVDPNAMNWEGRTVLMTVTDLCHKICDNSMVACLLNDERVRPNLLDNEGMTALTISASYGNCENMGYLLTRDDIDVNLGAERQQFVLHNAIRSRSVATVEMLLDDDRLDTLTKDEAGWTPFLIAVDRSSPKIIRLLLESGRCSLDDRVEGRHAWSVAVEREHNGVMALLVEYGDMVRSSL